MQIAISGSHGMLGSQLVTCFADGGHQITRLVRGQPQGRQEVRWDPQQGVLQRDQLEGIEAVIHLAGENLATGRWNEAKRQRIRDSRVIGTRQLCQSLAQLEHRPRVLIAASAIGFYGDRGDQLLDEQSDRGTGFLADVVEQWEAATEAAETAGIRVVLLRFGMILSTHGGALAKMLLPFRWGLGGVVGRGQQYWSWISLEDAVGVVSHALAQEDLSGPVNAVAPEAVTNRQFTRTLGRVLHRPTPIPLPAAAMRLALGPMADELLLASTRVDPKRLRDSHYAFRFPLLEQALRHELGRETRSA